MHNLKYIRGSISFEEITKWAEEDDRILMVCDCKKEIPKIVMTMVRWYFMNKDKFDSVKWKINTFNELAEFNGPYSNLAKEYKLEKNHDIQYVIENIFECIAKDGDILVFRDFKDEDDGYGGLYCWHDFRETEIRLINNEFLCNISPKGEKEKYKKLDDVFLNFGEFYSMKDEYGSTKFSIPI